MRYSKVSCLLGFVLGPGSMTRPALFEGAINGTDDI